MEAEGRRYSYSNEFFTYIEEGAQQSAQVIVPLIGELLGVKSVLDVGCGRGIWLEVWRQWGTADIVGVDGDYIDESGLAIRSDKFVKCDVSQPFDLKRRFDLVQSLEVGEHLAETRADDLVRNLAEHGDAVLFSAAVPGQGGEFHINEQPYEYWRDKFSVLGFRTFDWLRPRIRHIAAIEPWYRYNTLLFARGGVLDRAPNELLSTEIPRHKPVPTLAPLSWRVRNRLLAQLPQRSVHRLAILKHRLIRLRRSAGSRYKRLRSAN